MNRNILAIAGGVLGAVVVKTIFGSGTKKDNQDDTKVESKAPPKDPLMDIVGFRYAALGTDAKIANLFLSLSNIKAYIQQPLTELAKEVDSFIYAYNRIRASQSSERNWTQDMVEINGFTTKIDNLITEIRTLLVDAPLASVQFESFRSQLDSHLMDMRTMLYSILNS